MCISSHMLCVPIQSICQDFVATGPSGPVPEKSTGPDEKWLVQIFKFKYFLYLNEISSQHSNPFFIHLNEICSQLFNSI